MTDTSRRTGSRGDERALAALLTSKLPMTYRVAVAILGSEADAQDAVDGAWRAARARLSTAPSGPDVDPWLVRLLVDACRGRATRNAAVVEELDAGHPISPADPTSDGAGLGGAFDRLDADQRALLTLQHLEQWPLVAIAEVAGSTEDVTTRQLHTARLGLERHSRADRPGGPTRSAPLSDAQIRAMLLDRATPRIPPELYRAVLSDASRARTSDASRASGGSVWALIAGGPEARRSGSIVFAAAAVLLAGSVLIALGYVPGLGRPAVSAPATTAPTQGVAIATPVPTAAPTPVTACEVFTEAAQAGGVGTGPPPIPGLPPDTARNGQAITLMSTQPYAPFNPLLQPPYDPAVFDPLAPSPSAAVAMIWHLPDLAVSRWTPSADGSVLAAEIASPTCVPDVWVVRRNGTGLRTPFAANAGGTYGAAWSSSGVLAVSSSAAVLPDGLGGSDVLVWDPRTGDTLGLARPCDLCSVAPWPTRSLAWSPDGSLLAVDLLDRSCRHGAQAVASSPCPGLGVVDSTAYWKIAVWDTSPDATLRLVGWLGRSTLLAAGDRQLLRVQTDGSGSTAIDLPKPLAQIQDAILSPDRGKVLVITPGVERATTVVDLRSGKETILDWTPMDIVDATWSPDSRFVLFQAGDDGLGSGPGFYVIPADGSSRPVLGLPGEFGATAWLPPPT